MEDEYCRSSHARQGEGFKNLKFPRIDQIKDFETINNKRRGVSGFVAFIGEHKRPRSPPRRTGRIVNLEPASAPSALLPCGVAGDGSAVLDAADLHASTGESSQSRLRTRAGGLRAVST